MVEATDGPVVVLNGAADLGERRQHGPDGGAARLAEKGHELTRRLVGHRDVEADVVEDHGDHEVLAGDGVGDEAQRFGLGVRLPEVGDSHAVEFGPWRR